MKIKTFQTKRQQIFLSKNNKQYFKKRRRRRKMQLGNEEIERKWLKLAKHLKVNNRTRKDSNMQGQEKFNQG
jgi:hypothetical protein